MKNRSIKNINVYDCTTQDGLDGFWRFISSKTKKEFSTDPQTQTLLENTIIKFDENYYLAIESFLGAGFFSYAFKVAEYDFINHTKKSTKSVLKMPKPLYEHNLILYLQHFISEYFFNLTEDFEKEAKLFEILHGNTKIITFNLNGKQLTFSLLPFLGDLPLSSLMTDRYLLQRISTKEWLDLFLKLLEKLNAFHQKTNFIHNDIRPGNITLVIKKIPNGLFSFELIDLIDYGSAQLPKHRGRIGDPRYNSPIMSFLGLIIPFKDKQIDTNAMGATLIDFLDALHKVIHPQLDKIALEACRHTFKKMANIMGNFQLADAIRELQLIKNEYARVIQYEKNLRLKEALQNFLRTEQNGVSTKQTRCGFFNAKQSNREISINTCMKLLSLLEGNQVELNPRDFIAINTGKLGDIITYHRMQGQLPDSFINLENSANSAYCPIENRRMF